jgi:3-oxoacyl-[acyl-carrier protein] reductase
MGRSIALTLAREGACVAVNYRGGGEAAAHEIAELLRERGGQAIAIQADIFSRAGCQSLVEDTLRVFGRIDICIIGPGGGWHAEPVSLLDGEMALEDLHQEVAPIYFLLPSILPQMYERGWGRVIAISLLPPYASPAYAYNVAKAARTEAMLLAKEAAWAQGVTLNIIAPGPVSAIESLAEAVEQCYHGQAWKSRTAVSPQDIAEGVAFLCSEAGSFITGCVLPYSFR